MTQREVDKVLLALYAVREVGPKASLEQLKAVCYCLRNRVRAGWGEWMAVIEQANENAAHEPGDLFPIDPTNRAYQRLLRDVDEIYFGQSSGTDGSVDGGDDLESALCESEHPCMYWCFINRPMRPKFAQNIVRDPGNHSQRATMGLMMFFE